jgi:hypothetical protein
MKKFFYKKFIRCLNWPKNYQNIIKVLEKDLKNIVLAYYDEKTNNFSVHYKENKKIE